MTAALIFDTETADFHDESQSADPVQLALVLSNIETGRTIWTYSVVISRRGWPTPRPPVADRVIRIHGMDTDYCNRWGEAPQIALDVFRRALGMASLVVAHNIEFDVGVMTTAFSTMHLPRSCGRSSSARCGRAHQFFRCRPGGDTASVGSRHPSWRRRIVTSPEEKSTMHTTQWRTPMPVGRCGAGYSGTGKTLAAWTGSR